MVRKIITVTLNPAVDKHICKSDANGRDTLLRVDYGGKGVNVSKALLACGFESECYVMCGRDGAAEYLAGLKREGVSPVCDVVNGRVRENLHIDNGGADEVEFGSGAPVGAKAAKIFEAWLEKTVIPGCVLCFSGSIESGSDKSAVVSALEKAAHLGAELIVDSRSFDLFDLARLRPALVKPNEEELYKLVGGSCRSDVEWGLEKLRNAGVGAILLTLGKDGLIYSTENGTAVKQGVEVNAVSTTGAGDSTLAAAIIARELGFSAEETAELALAFGTAACVTEGSKSPSPCEIKKYFCKRRFTI